MGKERIVRILNKRFPEINYSIDYIPYQLYPNIPIEGKPIDSFQKSKTEGLGKKLHIEAASENIVFNFSQIKMIPNTLLAHFALSKLDLDVDKSRLSSAIFKSHFTDGEDIGDVAVLQKLLSNISDKEITMAYNKGDLSDVKNIIEQQKEEHDIYQVPSYKINDAGVLPGVLPEAMFIKWITKMSR